MKCLPLPTVPNPTLAGGITIAPTLPVLSFNGELCCKILTFDVATPPLELPAFILSGAAPGLNAAIAAVQAYIDALPLRCPRE